MVYYVFSLKSYGISESMSTNGVKYSTFAGALARLGAKETGRGTFMI